MTFPMSPGPSKNAELDNVNIYHLKELLCIDIGEYEGYHTPPLTFEMDTLQTKMEKPLYPSLTKTNHHCCLGR